MIPHGPLLHIPQDKFIAFRLQVQQQEPSVRRHQHTVRIHITVTLAAKASVELFNLMEQFAHPFKQKRLFYLPAVFQPVDQQFALDIVHCRPAASSMLYKF